MSKTYELYCPRHGKTEIRIENPPIMDDKMSCPCCGERLLQPLEKEKKPQGVLRRVYNLGVR